MKIATNRANPDLAAGREADPEHELLGDPVEERAQGQRGPAVGAVGAAAPTSARRVTSGDRAVEPEVGEGADSETEPRQAGATQRDAFLRQLEADRADQRPGAESEDEADLALRPAVGEGQRRADHE